MKRMLSASTVLFVLLFSVQAYAGGWLGRSTIGTIQSGGLRADFKRGSKFTLSEPSLITHMCAYLDGAGGGTGRQSVRFAMYRDSNGVPGAKVTETQEQSMLPGGSSSQGWVCEPAGNVPVPAGKYWLMIHTGGAANVIRYYYDGAPNWYGAPDTFSDGSNVAFGAGGTGDGTISIYAGYMLQTEWKLAGASSVGSTPSAGMRADFKRASSVVLPRRATVYGINVFIDGLGGGEGAGQAFDVELYADDNGKPGARLTGVNLSGMIAPGHIGRWVSAQFGSTLMEPGRYWISILTGQSTGILRYFMQGTGNWYGNVNQWEDYASNPFGPAAPGDGTISANLVYGPPFEPPPPMED